MGELSNWASDNSQFLKLEIGQEVDGVYLGYKIIPDKFNPDEETIQYKIEVDGKVKYWENKSGAVAQSLDDVKPKSNIRIGKEKSKDGKGRYYVTVQK